MLDTHFYHNNIRNYTALVGTLFNELKIVVNAVAKDVPINYVGTDKTRARGENNSIEGKRVKIMLPRMSFQLVGWDMNPARKVNKMHQMKELSTSAVKTAGTQKNQYHRVPYDFAYELNIKTKNVGEMLQLVEQILATFDPFVDIIVKDSADLGIDSAIRIKLADSSMIDESVGAVEESRIVEATFNFTLEGYLYKATSTSKIIKSIDIDFFLESDMNVDSQLTGETIHIDENTP